MTRMVFLSLSVMTIAAVVSGCTGFDQKKFDRVYRAGKALEVEVHTTGGASPRSEELQKEFDLEVSALKGRVDGEQETLALRAFSEASDAYRYFIRFRFLDFEAVDGQILLMGTNLDAASRYSLPVETVAGNRWVESSVALKALLVAADSRLAEANRLVNGQ